MVFKCALRTKSKSNGATLGRPPFNNFPRGPGRVKTANAASIRRWPTFLRNFWTSTIGILIVAQTFEWPSMKATPINKEDGRVASSKFIIIFKLWSLQNRGDWWALVLLKSCKTVAKIAMRFTYHLTAGQRRARQETLVISYRSFYDLSPSSEHWSHRNGFRVELS